MNKFFKFLFSLFIILLLPAFVHADVSWYIYVSTASESSPKNYGVQQEIRLSTGTVDVVLPNNEDSLKCSALPSFYFWPERFPYPLTEDRYFFCDLGKEYSAAVENGCSLRYNDVKDTELVLFTPSTVYKIDFQCANLIKGKTNE